MYIGFLRKLSTYHHYCISTIDSIEKFTHSSDRLLLTMERTVFVSNANIGICGKYSAEYIGLASVLGKTRMGLLPLCGHNRFAKEKER